MRAAWDDIEALETISRNEGACDLFLRMAELSTAGGLGTFLSALDESPEIDPETKAVFAEVAQDTDFLRALEDYVHRTRVAH